MYYDVQSQLLIKQQRHCMCAFISPFLEKIRQDYSISCHLTISLAREMNMHTALAREMNIVNVSDPEIDLTRTSSDLETH
jgi:hypothetical protein